MSYTFQILDITFKDYTNLNEIENLLDDARNELQDLEDELEEKNQNDVDDAELINKINLYKADIEHVENAICNLSMHETFYSESIIDDHLKSSIDGELESLSSLIRSNLDMDGIISDLKTGYSEFIINNETFYYLA